MEATLKIAPESRKAHTQRELEDGSLQAIDGVLQRVDYRAGEFKLVAPGKVWSFKVSSDSQLWFNDRQAILRCFHPLDPVRVIFEPAPETQRVRALYAWEAV